MNAITARALAHEAAVKGQKVIVVSSSSGRCSDAFVDFDALKIATATRIVRVYGRQRIDYVSGGSVRFVSPRQTAVIRGASADTVFVDWDVETGFPGQLETIYAELAPLISGRPNGRIVRA